MVSNDFKEVAELAEAVEALKETSYNQQELEQYDKYWDIVRTQQAFVTDALKKGKMEEKLSIGKNLKTRGLSYIEIREITGLSLVEIESL